MKHTGPTTDSRPLPAGFSLIELLVVVGIIMVIAAVGAPAIANWAKNYQIRGATQTLASDIQTARNRAISKNANLGVAIVVEDANTYWTHVEDDQTPPKDPARRQLDLAAPDDVQSARRRLPAGIEFALTAADCPVLAGFAPADYGFRFNRLGAWCDPGAGGACPEVDIAGATANAVFTVGGTGSTLCLLERQSGLSRTVTVTPGGRVQAQQ
jgi:prepilin-type N-terminal cleavage/methylation domain-containing protein